MFEESNRFRDRSDRSTEAGLTLAPMIDVVFLLLIFFMVSTTFIVRPGLNLDLPESQSQSDVNPDHWVVSVSPEGNYYLNQDPVDLNSLNSKLQSDPKPVIVRADRSVPHGVIVDVLDTVQLTDIENITISTRKRSGE